jgi:hypothetical protein
MAFDCKKFKRVMDSSGLTKAELAKLFGVSRQALYLWCDRAPGQKTLAERAEKYTDGIIAAMSRGLLPFAATVSPERRTEFLLTMAKRLHTLTAPK